jgi:hypothetical protein
MFMRLGPQAWVSGKPMGVMGFRDCLDGTANTVAIGEICYTTGRRELKGNIFRVPQGVWPANQTLPSIAQATRDPLRQSYYVADGAVGTMVPSIGGDRWSDMYDNMFMTAVPPNGPSIVRSGNSGGNSDHRLLTAGSYHRGGIHVVMLDGAVKFITENIDSGNQGAGTDFNANAGIESPWGLWGAMGTRSGSENKGL